MNILELNEQEIFRRESLQELRDLGIDPYPAALYKVDAYSTEIKETFEEEATPPRQVSIAGRIMSRRIMGKASFLELMDSKGRIQVYITRDDICPDENKDLYNTVFRKLLDIGDFIGITGFVFRTKMGEISVHAQTMTVLAKSLKPLPVVKTKDGVSYDSFTDPEMRHRQRYVDLIVNEHVRDNELYLKRLIVGGFDGVYEFSRNFRNEGMDRTHNPEFTVMEIYVAYTDYNWMMEFTEQMLEYVAMQVLGTTKATIGENTIDFKAPYRRITMIDSIEENTGINVAGMNEEELREVCKKLNVEQDETMGVGKLIDEIFGEKCEGTYIQPTFITDYPIEMSPLTKKHRTNPTLTERFELMVNGKELANAYSELNDPIDQRERFEAQVKLSEKGDDEAMFIDHDFLRALEYGMPPTSGMGIGMDRLAMYLTGQESIQEVLLFPQMRPEKTAKKDEVSKYTAIGVPEEWVVVVQKAGYNTVESLKDVNHNKLHQELCGLNKKFKLELNNPSPDEVKTWTEQVSQT